MASERYLEESPPADKIQTRGIVAWRPFRKARTGGMVLGAVMGVAFAAAAFTFWYGHGASYLVDDPDACANCHAMNAHLAGWMQGSHRSAATCNDCHTPKNLLAKYVTKADNGFWHSYAFTSGRYPETIRIKDRNRAITEARCRHCHQALTDAIQHDAEETLSCIRCHANVGHRT